MVMVLDVEIWINHTAQDPSERERERLTRGVEEYIPIKKESSLKVFLQKLTRPDHRSP